LKKADKILALFQMISGDPGTFGRFNMYKGIVNEKCFSRQQITIFQNEPEN
jgi:hypothetical protein